MLSILIVFLTIINVTTSWKGRNVYNYTFSAYPNLSNTVLFFLLHFIFYLQYQNIVVHASIYNEYFNPFLWSVLSKKDSFHWLKFGTSIALNGLHVILFSTIYKNMTMHRVRKIYQLIVSRFVLVIQYLNCFSAQ